MRHLGACATGWFLATILCAGEPAKSESPFPVEEARRLVREMGDNDVKKREAAFDVLLRLADFHPEQVLALLPGERDMGDLEVQARCADLRRRISPWNPLVAPWTRGDEEFTRAAVALFPSPTYGTIRELYLAAGEERHYEAARILGSVLLPRARTVDQVSDLVAHMGMANGRVSHTVPPGAPPFPGLGEVNRKELVAIVAPYLKHANDQVRQAAGVALCDLAAREYTAQVLALIPEYRFYMTHRVDVQARSLDPELTRKTMEKYLDHAEWTVRETAARTLGAMCPGEEALAERALPLLDDPWPPARKAAFNAIVAFLGHEKALPLLASRVVGDTSGLAHDNMAICFNMALDEELHHALATWFGDSRWWVRLRAMAYMGEHQKLCPHVLPQVERFLADPNEKVRIQAIVRLGRIGDRSSVPKLAVFLDDARPYIQLQAGISIGMLVDGYWMEARKWARVPAWPGMEPAEKAARMEAEMMYKDSARHAREWWEANKGTFGKGEPAPAKETPAPGGAQ